jgi:OOP family OmpA-OmpF porin
MRRITSLFLTAGGLAALMLGAPSVHAQSAEQLINQLKPKTSVMGGTRGIHPVGPAATPAPTATPAANVAPVGHVTTQAPAASQTEPASVDLNVQFSTGSAELTQAAVRTLNELGKALSSPTLAEYHFRIEGHTDTVGTAEANKALSERRAETVVNYLSSKFGVKKSRLQAVGMGEESLLVPTPDQTAEVRNRRVHVVNTGA